MAKFIKPFRGVPEGEIYPVQFVAGDDCPSELEVGALSVGALSLIATTVPPPVPQIAVAAAPDGYGEKPDIEPVTVPAGEVTSGSTVDANATPPDADVAGAAEQGESLAAVALDKPELISQLEAASIPFDKRWGTERLAAALAEGKKE
ncbi:hypothetical protein [Stenotrophomonas muris]|uniref:hypothetical protein n=1 Tax=Stenotrophomonas muris TaxID=2963283 RepID=UPI002E762BAC|nr:hypothetical protein [Stenotrophomonas muris]